MSPPLEIRPVSGAERDAVVAMLAAGQADPARHIAYLSLEADAIGEELGELEPDGWDGVFVAHRDGQLVGALATEHDREPPRVWWYGPYVVSGASYLEVGRALLAAARDRLPAHVVEEELAADLRHLDLAELARAEGFEAGVASAVLRRPTAPSSATHHLAAAARDVEVRAFVEADRAAVADLHDRSFPRNHLPGHRVADGDGRIVLVVGPPGAVVGYAASEVQADGSGYVDLLAVEAGARGQGIGAALLLATLAALAARGAEEAHLTVREVDAAARRLYDRLGFAEERTLRPYRRGGSVKARYTA